MSLVQSDDPEQERSSQIHSFQERSFHEQKKKEWRLFVFIIVFLFPLLSIALVGGYGFAIWMYQLLMGPPSMG